MAKADARSGQAANDQERTSPSRETCYAVSVDSLDLLIPGIIVGISNWVEDRYGTLAARIVFTGMLAILTGGIALAVYLLFFRGR